MRLQSLPVPEFRNFSWRQEQVARHRRGFLRRLAAVTAAGVALPVSAAHADDDSGGAPGDDVTQNVPDVAQAALTPLEVQVLALVNGARAERGLPPLTWDATMTGVAREHAGDMMAHGMVSHVGTDGSTPQDRLRRAGVSFQFGSENIWTYWGGDPGQGPSTMHAAMMSEPFAPGLWNHIGNILYRGYRRIGVGVVVARSGVQYLSETFAD
jgi:uncharacterized protein YkwD